MPGGPGDEYRRAPFLNASGLPPDALSWAPPPFTVASSASGEVTRVTSDSVAEDLSGCCRAVRHNRSGQISVSATSAARPGRIGGGNDAVAQTHFAIDVIEGLLRGLDATLADVTRTRVYVRHRKDCMAVAAAHGARFGDAKPAYTLVQANLAADEALVEIEVEAWAMAAPAPAAAAPTPSPAPAAQGRPGPRPSSNGS